MSESRELAARLRRLRRDTPPIAGPTAGPKRATKPAELSAAARRLLARRSRRASAPAAGEESATGARTVGPPGELERRTNALGSFAVRMRRFAGDHLHGAWRLEEIDQARVEDVVLLTRDAALDELRLRDAVYLDIETTGLSGGAGTMPFMIALGVFDGTGFELYQGFLEGPEQEAALLLDVAERIARRGALVSFFGKSFDRHRLEDKMRIHGIAPPFAGRPHLDLYHPLRRLYGGAWDDGRLGTCERELCGVERTDDLSGRYAPEAWFDFLAGRGHRLEDVFRHNEDDVLSLVVLAAHLGRVVSEERACGTALEGPPAHRAAALARRLFEGRRHDEALAWVERALARGPGRDRALRLLQADLLATLGRVDEADELHAALADEAEDKTAVQALVALAKRAEHRRRDPATALAHVVRAARVARRTGLVRGALARDLARREERLAGRVG